MRTVTCFLVIDFYGQARVTKRPPQRVPGHYIWRIKVAMPDAPRMHELELTLPACDDAEMIELDIEGATP